MSSLACSLVFVILNHVAPTLTLPVVWGLSVRASSGVLIASQTQVKGHSPEHFSHGSDAISLKRSFHSVDSLNGALRCTILRARRRDQPGRRPRTRGRALVPHLPARQ
jgi:hypothetical protein